MDTYVLVAGTGKLRILVDDGFLGDLTTFLQRKT